MCYNTKMNASTVNLDYCNSRDFLRKLANSAEVIDVSKDRFVTFRRDVVSFVTIYDLCNIKDRSLWTEQEELSFNQAKDIFYVNAFPKNYEYLTCMKGRIFTEEEIESEIEAKTTIGVNIVSNLIKYNIFLEELFYQNKLNFI